MELGATEVDQVDAAILDLLSENARRSFGDIGGRVGLSASAVKRRVDRLEASGVIQRYTVEIDDARIGRALEAFVELRFGGATRVDDIEHVAPESSEIVAIFTVAGDPDALAWLRVKDVNALKAAIDKIRASSQVIGTKTLMVLGSTVRRHPLG